MANYPFTAYNQPFANYGQNYFPQQNSYGYTQNSTPFMPQNQQFQAPQTQTIPAAPIAGRMVEKVEDITVNEIPNNGSVGYFPKADGSAIFAKTWTNDGKIITMEYVPKPLEEPKEAEEPKATLADVMAALNDLSTVVDAISAAINKPQQTTPAKRTTKKEEADA